MDRLKLGLLVIQLTGILLKERPQVVVTTGSGPGMITLTLAKMLLRSKTIWIDSIANCERMSSSGSAGSAGRRYLVNAVAPALQHESGPNYWGAVL